MKLSKVLEKTAFTRKQKRLLLFAAMFPVIIYSVAVIKQIAEQCFRLSQAYHYIYSVVSTVGLFIQMNTLLLSVPFALYVLIGRKTFNNQLVVGFSILLSLVPLAWILVNLAFL